MMKNQPTIKRTVVALALKYWGENKVFFDIGRALNMHTKNTKGNLTVDLLKKVDSCLLQDFPIVINCMTGVLKPPLKRHVSVSSSFIPVWGWTGEAIKKFGVLEVLKYCSWRLKDPKTHSATSSHCKVVLNC